MPGAVAAFAVTSTLGFVLGIETEMQQRVLVPAGDQVDVASAAAISTARSATRDEFLPPKSQAAIAALAGLYINPDFVDEQV